MILLLSTSILYGIGMFGALCSTWGDYDCMSGIQFFSVAIASLFYMVPTWIIVIILNSLYVKQPPTESADNSRNEVAE